ncbi:hypothetical protein ABOM_012133 [Aspergillus bombycis]|uniref:EKC/KEOPS complex subunit BUD32 n=1 Tax=Aspergillus bombycis TaxID=109264 RepID=A0A1F7ZIX1_9EURO|nr:hypothetical protein ABOM_012133 [Aspergillus bombycis]OGM39397.1 hypothetical protein ABOM_012133 [Aspergillus bombycis]
MSLPEANDRAALPETPTGFIGPLGFVKHGNPFTMDRLFVGLEPAWGGVDAIEFTEDMPVSFVTRVNRSQHDIPLDRLRETSHRHLFNLKEVFVTEQSLFLFYAEWEGISLKEIQTLRPAFQLGEVEVATICYQIFQGLRYIHDTLDISHGDIREENIYIHKNGDVKIGISYYPTTSLFQLPGLSKNR